MEKESAIFLPIDISFDANKFSEKIKKRIETVQKYLNSTENDKAFNEIESILAQAKTGQCDFETIHSLLECMIQVKKNISKKPWGNLFYQLRTEVMAHFNLKQQSQLLVQISESYKPDEEPALWYLTEALTLNPEEISYTHRLTIIENHHYLAQFEPYSLLVKELGRLRAELPKRIDSFMKNKNKSHSERIQLFLDVKRLLQYQPPSTSKEWQKSYEQYQTFLEEYSKQLARRIELFFLRQQKDNEDLDLALFPKESLAKLLEELHDSLSFILGWENQLEAKQQNITRTILRANIWDAHQNKFKLDKIFTLLEKCFSDLDTVQFPAASFSQLWINARWIHHNAKNHFFALSTESIKAHEDYQKSFFSLLQHAIKSLSESLTPPPCDWGFYLTGSRARGDASPRSDLDITLLIAHEKYLNDDFFKALLKGIQSLIIALGDCWQWTEQGCQAIGIQIDSGDLNQSHLQMIGPIQTPKLLAEKVAAALQNIDEKNLSDFILAFSLLIVKPVYATKEAFLSNYQNSLKQVLTSINLPIVGWSILKNLRKTRYPFLKDYLSSFHLMGLAFCCFEAAPPFFTFEWQSIYPLYAQYINPAFAKQCIDDLQQLYRIRKTFHATHFVQEIPVRNLTQNEQTFLESIKERLKIFLEGFPEKYASLIQSSYCPYQAYVGKHYQTLSDDRIIQLLKMALAQKEVFELPLSLIKHLQTLLEKEFKEKQFTDLSLFDLCVAIGTHPDTLINHKSLIEHAFEQKNISAITALIQKGAGQHAHFLMDDWIVFLEKTTPQTFQTLLSMWSKHNAYVNWYCGKQILFEPAPKRERNKEELARFVEGVEIKQQLLREKIYQQMFETKSVLFSTTQEAKKDNDYGRRTVTKIEAQQQTFFFKFFPEAAPMEDAVQQLAHSYFPGTVPYSELIRYENEKGEIIPILISEGIQGYNLQDIFNALSDEPKVQAEALKKGITPELAQSCLDNIDHYSFSQQVLLTLFTNDEDGKPDNKYLVPFQQSDKTLFRIVSIDNDHSFLEPLHIEKGKRILQLKSILFCLDNMKRPLHPQAVAEFVKLNATECIENWLKKLIVRQESYFKLFDSQKKNLDSIRETLLKKEVILQFIFPKRSIAKLWEKWTNAQNCLNRHLEITALELLRQVMPEVALFYAQAFKETTPLKRFDQVAEKSYTSILINNKKLGYTSTSKSVQLLALQGVSKNALAQKENGLFLVNSLEELRNAKHEHVNIEHILKEVEKGLFGLWEQLYLDNNKAAVINALDWKKLNEKQQKQLLELLAAKGLNARALLLSQCAILNDSLLESLLTKMPGLQQLSIIDGQITDRLWALLSNFCESIQSIRLENLPKLSNTTQGLFSRIEIFIELNKLNLENLPQFRILKINAPQLKTFTMDKLPELISVETQSTALETFFIQDTPKLNLNSLANSFESITPFKKGLLPKHWQLDEKLMLYISYPFLLSRTSFKWVLQFSEDCNELLKSFPKEAINAESLLTFKQLIEMHCKQFELTEKTLPKLLIALKDSDWQVRRAAAQALGSPDQHATEPVIATLLEMLKDSDWDVRQAAAQAFGNLGPKAATQRVIGVLLSAFKDSVWNVRKAAAQALGNLGQHATEPVIAGLLSAFKDSAWPVRQAAAQALGNLGPKAATEPVIAALLSAFKDSDWPVRQTAAQALGNLGPKAAIKPVIAALLSALEDNHKYVREAAAQAFGNLGPKAVTEPVIAALLEMLKDSDSDTRSAAAQALGNLGQYATEPVIAALLSALKDNHKHVRKTAAQAFGNLDPKAATESIIAALLERLMDSDRYVRETAALALSNLGPKAATEPVIAVFLEMLKDSYRDVRDAAAQALGNLGQYATEPVITALLERLKDSDSWVRSAAAQALGYLGPKAATEPVIAALIERLKDGYEQVRHTAAQALGYLGPKAATEPVIAALLEMLKDKDWQVRPAAAQALGNLGPKAATGPVIAALLGALKDSDKDVRKAAAEALGSLAQSLNETYRPFFDTLIQQKNAYLAEFHKIEFMVSDRLTEIQLIELLKKVLESNTPIMKIKIHGLNSHSKEAFLLIQKWIESNPASLIHLDLEQNIFEGKLIHQFITETLSQCKQLQSIHLNHTQLNDSIWPALEIILPQLKSLSLKHNQLKDIDSLVGILPKCTKLTHLYLQGNLFTPADLHPLLKADLNPELKQHLQQQFENNALTQNHFLKPSKMSDESHLMESTTNINPNL